MLGTSVMRETNNKFNVMPTGSTHSPPRESGGACEAMLSQRPLVVRIGNSVGGCLCYGLQSQSPNDPHLCFYVGMDCNPRAQGTPGPFQWPQNE